MRKALIIRRLGLGDVVLAEPCVRAIAKKGCYDKIFVDAGANYAIYANHPDVSINQNEIDKIFSDPSTADIFELTYEHTYETFRLKHDLLSSRLHMVDGYLARYNLKEEDKKPRIYLKEEDVQRVKSIINPNHRWAVFDIGHPDHITLGRVFFEWHEWKPIVKFLKNRKFKIACIGNNRKTKIDKEDVDLNLIGKTSLKMLLSIMKNCNLFLGVISGPVCIADALDINGIVITHYDPNKFLSKNSSIQPVFNRNLDCEKVITMLKQFND